MAKPQLKDAVSDSEPKEKKQRRAAAPKTLYLVYTVEDGKLVTHAASFKSDKALEALDANPGAQYKKMSVQ